MRKTKGLGRQGWTLARGTYCTDKHKHDFFSFKDRHEIPATREAKAGGVQV